MSTSTQKQTGRLVARVVSAALATSLLGACPAKKDESDGGASKVDGGLRDASVPRDAAVKKDGGSEGDSSMAMTSDSMAMANDSGLADGGKLDGSAAPPDAGPVDPSTPGTDSPTLTTVGYFVDDLGPRWLILGRDANGDIASWTIKFFNGTSPVGYDDDNISDTPDITELTGQIVPVPGEAGFFLQIDTTDELAAAVDNVKILVTDSGGRTSEELPAMRQRAPTVSTKCDANGFNRCGGSSVCSKSGTAYSCKSVSSARTSACTTALTLAPPAVTSVSGRVQRPSLWDPPAGCATGDLAPDRIVKLTLAADAVKVVLSTNTVNTSFDTILYQLTTCAAQPASCVDETCPCSDDILAMGDMPRVNRSRLELHNVPKGDYLFVVDSRPTAALTGDWFELTATVE